MEDVSLKKIKLDIKLEENDLVKYLLKRYYNKKSVRYLTFLGIIACLFTPVLLWEIISMGLRAPFGAYLMIGLAIFTIYLPFSIKKSAKNSYANNKLIQQIQHYCIGFDGLKVDSETNNANITWEKLFKAEETKNEFLLFIDRFHVCVLPKRFFSKDEDIELLRELLLKNLSPKKLKIKKD